jgi:tripartite-type tricarboxylate transporter receptor subunit TctC
MAADCNIDRAKARVRARCVAVASPRRRGAPPTVGGAAALDYPVRPVRLIAANSAGSAVDFLARLMAQWLSDRFGQQFPVEDRPGAGGNIGTEAVVRAAPDDYTLLLVTTSNMTNASLYDKLGYNLMFDTTAASIGYVRAGQLRRSPSPRRYA